MPTSVGSSEEWSWFAERNPRASQMSPADTNDKQASLEIPLISLNSDYSRIGDFFSPS